MPTQVIPLEGIDKAGVIMDSPAVTLPPGAWTDARNVRFDDGAIRRMKGQASIFPDDIVFPSPADTGALGNDITPIPGNIKYVSYWENPNVRCYVVINGEPARPMVPDNGIWNSGDATENVDSAYLITVGGDGQYIISHKGTFISSNSWDSLQYNGGYSLIINNAIDPPQHISVQLGGTADITMLDDFVELPGWDSYASGTVAAGFVRVATEILIPYGNLLVAAALTERAMPPLSLITNAVVTSTTRITFTLAESHTLVPGDIFEVTGNGNYTFTWVIAGDGTALNPDVPQSQIVSSPYNGVYRVPAGENNQGSTTLVAEPVDRNMPPMSDPFADSAPTALDLGRLTNDPDTAALIPPYVYTFGTTSYHTEFADGTEPDTVILRDLNGVVRTSSVAAPGSIPNNWDPFALGANTADEINLADAGKITSVRELRGNLFVYTSDSITQLRVSNQGLTAVPITKEYGALTHTGVFSWRGSHVVVGSDDIYIFQGNPADIKSIADGRVRDYFYTQLDVTKFRNMQFIRNQLYDEVWLCYPTSEVDDETLNEALIWAYNENTWTIRDLPNVTSIAKGPIPGEGNQGMRFDLTGLDEAYSLLVTTADGRFTTPDGGPFQDTLDNGVVTSTASENLAIAVTNAINQQSGFSARRDGTFVIFSDSRLGKNAWSIQLFVGGVEVVPMPFENTNEISDRPWQINVFNESENFIVMSTVDDIVAAEIGFAGFEEVFFEKYNFHLTPTKDTEILSAMYLLTEGDRDLRVTLWPIETAGMGARDMLGEPLEYEFSMTGDYKIDTRITSRLIKMRFEEIRFTDDQGMEINPVTTDWSVAGIDLEVGKRGTR